MTEPLRTGELRMVRRTSCYSVCCVK